MKQFNGVWLPDADTHFAYMMGKEIQRECCGRMVGTYQYFKIAKALELCESFDTAIDVGGHVGFWSMWLAERFRHVHAFEPVEDHADCFERNANMANVTLHRMALGSSIDTVSMSRDADNSGKAYIDGRGIIPMTTLDAFNLSGVGLLKIDVEGYEAMVLRGAAETILREKPLIVMEVNKNRSRYTLDDPELLLLAMGYSLCSDLGADRIYHADKP